jgi:N-acylneuraminate cytidylyltransferase
MTSRDDETDPLASTLVVIPARGGSKGIKDKNLERVGGRPLVTRAVESAATTPGVSHVVVSTDDPRIARLAAAAGATVVERPKELAGDESSSESAVLHALDWLGEARLPDVTVLLQCTSPFIDKAALGRAIRRVARNEADVAISVLPSHSFIWREGVHGLVGVNHEAHVRLRRQDRKPEVVETGAFYVMRTAGLIATRHRFHGRVVGEAVHPLTAMEIDTTDDLALARAISSQLDNPRSTPVHVDALVTDFDGVHTDDRAWLGEDGREFVAVSRSDGMGISQVKAAGIKVLILSTEANPVVRARAAKLGVAVMHGVDDKASALRAWMKEQGLDPDRVAYLGNDLNDLAAMDEVGWPVAVPNARTRVKAQARLVLAEPAGDGAVRELCDLILASTRPEEGAP